MKRSFKYALGAGASALFLSATAGAASFYDFGAIGAAHEQGYSTYTKTVGGLTLTATANNNYFVYLDGLSSGKPAGMGVCKNLLSDLKCTPSNDDNVTFGEVLTWNFSQALGKIDLTFRDANHDPLGAKQLQYKLDSQSWTNFTPNLSSFYSLDMAGNTQVSFRTLSDTDQFYIQGATASAVPLPAAAWLFGSTVVGWLGIARRRKAV